MSVDYHMTIFGKTVPPLASSDMEVGSDNIADALLRHEWIFTRKEAFSPSRSQAVLQKL